MKAPRAAAGIGAVRFFTCLILTALALSFAAPAEPLSRHIGGGNLHPDRDEIAKLDLFQSLGLGKCRVPLQPALYRGEGEKRFAGLDRLLEAALERDIEPVLLLEYYTRWHGDIGGYEDWRRYGRDLAERYAPDSRWWVSRGVRGRGVRHFTAINEPMWADNNPTPIDPQAYRKALEGLADGVLGVDAGLQVSPGGFQEVPLFQKRNRYLPGLAELYNSGKLASLDIHRYWDVQHVPMTDYRFSLQRQFEEVKAWAGITRDIGFHTTEFNFKRRKVDEDTAAAGFLTALWDALGVTGADGGIVTRFVMPWNIIHASAQDEHYGMAISLEPWEPTSRGATLAHVMEIAGDLELVSADPKQAGLHVLRAADRELRVWQNRRGGWTDQPGTSFRLDNLPPGTVEVEIHRWNGLWKTLPISSDSLSLDDLPEEETLMFLLRKD